ncbi:MAG: cupin domain-containing protein [Acidobacteria bacterium]|nr:cupin domain-containing protein [Acidobacteriota bacterium]
MPHRRTVLQTLLAGALAAPSARPAGSQVRELRRESLTGPLDNLEAVWLEVTLAPGVASPVHKHPGPVFGFVLEGRFRFSVRGGPEQTLNPGDTFFEPLGAIHQTSSNAGDTPVRLGVVILSQPGRAISEAV